MTYSLIAHTFSAGASGGSTTSAIDTTGSDLIVVGVVYTNLHAPTLSDSKSNTWTAIGSAQTTLQEGVQLYYCQAPTTDAAHTFTVAGANSFSSAFVQAFSGSVASPLDQQTGNASTVGATSIATGSITPSQNNELITVMYGNEGSAVGQAMDSGMTLTDTQGISGPAWGSSMGYLIQTSATAINVTGSTNANATNSITIASFKEFGTDANVNLSIVSAAGAVSSLSVTLSPNISLVAVSGTGSAQALGGNPDIELVSVSASGEAGIFSGDKSLDLSAVHATGSALGIFGSASIIGVASVGTMRSILPIDAVLINLPVPSNGTMRNTPVATIGTLLVA